MDTAKKCMVSEFERKRFADKEGWVNTWVEAAVRELAKTIPLHVDTHRIYHIVVGIQTLMKKRFQNYPVKVNEEEEMELLEVSPVSSDNF